MEITIFILFDFIVAIFCLVTSLFLLSLAIRDKKRILFPFAVYFLLISLALFLLFSYVSIPNISSTNLGDILLICIALAYVGVFNLLITSFYVNEKKTTRNVFIQILTAILIFLLLLGLYPSNVHHYINNLPESSILYAGLLFICFSVIYTLCIWNIHSSESLQSTDPNAYFRKNLFVFYSLGIIITFTEIFGFFVVLLGTIKVEFNFMNIFTILFFIQAFVLIYSLPLKHNGKVYNKRAIDSIVNI